MFSDLFDPQFVVLSTAFSQGFYAFIVYTVLRNQLCRPNQGNYSLNNQLDNAVTLLENNRYNSHSNLVGLPPEKGSVKGTLTKAEIKNLEGYVNPVVSDSRPLCLDFLPSLFKRSLTPVPCSLFISLWRDHLPVKKLFVQFVRHLIRRFAPMPTLQSLLVCREDFARLSVAVSCVFESTEVTDSGSCIKFRNKLLHNPDCHIFTILSHSILRWIQEC